MGYIRLLNVTQSYAFLSNSSVIVISEMTVEKITKTCVFDKEIITLLTVIVNIIIEHQIILLNILTI